MIVKESGNQNIHDSSDVEMSENGYVETAFNTCTPTFELELCQNKHIVHICGTNISQPDIAVALSDHTYNLYNLSDTGISITSKLTGHTQHLIGCKFIPDNPFLLVTGSNDCVIHLWDIRTPKTPQNLYTDTTENAERKLLNCFDVSPNSRLLTAGTDLSAGDPYILFWDVRMNGLLGGYWESHSDDITQVSFHPSDSNKLVSGSTDGLINVYDLSQTCEDDALMDSLNTNSSVDKLAWLDVPQLDIGVVTHTNEVQIWNLDTATPAITLSRSDIANYVGGDVADTYVPALYKVGDSVLTIAGDSSEVHQCLAGSTVRKKGTAPALKFEGQDQFVKCCWFNEHYRMLLTAGDQGVLSVWNTSSLTGS